MIGVGGKSKCKVNGSIRYELVQAKFSRPKSGRGDEEVKLQ